MSLSKQNTKPKYCKVCHDTGKDEKTYTSHYVRETPDPSSRIVCPTLLSMECKYCYKKGHTVKFCKVIKNRSNKLNTSTRPMEVKPVKQSAERVSSNMYALLDVDDDNDTEMAPTQNHPPQTFVSSSAPPLSYAKIIEVTHKQVIEEEVQRLLKKEEARKEREANQEKTRQLTENKPVHVFGQFKRAHLLNWADDSSSDDEDLIQNQEEY